MPIIDRWISPGAVMEFGPLEYAEPPNGNQLTPVPAPAPPSVPLRPKTGNANEPQPSLILPTLPKTSKLPEPTRYNTLKALDDLFFEDEAGFIPAR